MKYRLNDEKIFADVADGIAILIDKQTGVYYGLNLLTTNVYENLVSGADTDELLSALSKVKGFSTEIKDRYDAFVKNLVFRGIIVENADTAASVQLSFDEFPNEDLDFILNEYPEASELLLADPIHQVKKETGWRPDREALR